MAFWRGVNLLFPIGELEVLQLDSQSGREATAPRDERRI